MAADLFGHDSSRPLQGDYVGAYVSPKGANVPLIIHIDEVGNDGTVTGSFTVLGDWANYIVAGPFHAARYSRFGTIHLDEDVTQKTQSGQTKLEIKIDGHFAAPTSTVGAIWGTLIVTQTTQQGSSEQIATGTLVTAQEPSSKKMATGTLATAYTKKAERLVQVSAISNPWDDGN